MGQRNDVPPLSHNLGSACGVEHLVVRHDHLIRSPAGGIADLLAAAGGTGRVLRHGRAMLLRRLGDQRLAEQLHHSVANDLATILLLARRARSTSEEVTATKMEGPADSEYKPQVLALDDDQLVTLIERTAEESLVKVRRLIAGLDRLTEPAADTASGRGSTSISSFHG